MVSVLKGGKYSLRYLHRKQLNEKYEIYRRTIKSIISLPIIFICLSIQNSVYNKKNCHNFIILVTVG